MKKTLYLAVSGHGFGHAGQIAPVVAKLRERIPNLHLVVRAAVPYRILDSLFGPEVEVIAGAPDPVIQMRGPLDIDTKATWQEYIAYHNRLRTHVDREKSFIRGCRADLVLADVPYAPILAAREISIPAIALCSINWADILEHYLPAEAYLEHEVITSIRECYRQAAYFIAPTPSMPMQYLPNLEKVGPIARVSSEAPETLRSCLPKANGKSIVLATMGGIESSESVPHYPQTDELHWIVPDAFASPERDDITPLGALGMPFLDILASCDAIVTKPGYGTFVEAACHGIPVVYVERDHWPESAALEAWLASNGVAVRISRPDYESGRFTKAIRAVLNAKPAPPVTPSGVDEAIHRIEGAFC